MQSFPGCEMLLAARKIALRLSNHSEGAKTPSLSLWLKFRWHGQGAVVRRSFGGCSVVVRNPFNVCSKAIRAARAGETLTSAPFPDTQNRFSAAARSCQGCAKRTRRGLALTGSWRCVESRTREGGASGACLAARVGGVCWPPFRRPTSRSQRGDQASRAARARAGMAMVVIKHSAPGRASPMT